MFHVQRDSASLALRDKFYSSFFSESDLGEWRAAYYDLTALSCDTNDSLFVCVSFTILYDFFPWLLPSTTTIQDIPILRECQYLLLVLFLLSIIIQLLLWKERGNNRTAIIRTFGYFFFWFCVLFLFKRTTHYLKEKTSDKFSQTPPESLLSRVNLVRHSLLYCVVTLIVVFT